MDVKVIPRDRAEMIDLTGENGSDHSDLVTLLAANAARQAGEPTAQIVRAHDRSVEAAGDAGRLMLHLTQGEKEQDVPQKSAGSFNVAVASHMTTGSNYECDVHRGG